METIEEETRRLKRARWRSVTWFIVGSLWGGLIHHHADIAFTDTVQPTPEAAKIIVGRLIEIDPASIPETAEFEELGMRIDRVYIVEEE